MEKLRGPVMLMWVTCQASSASCLVMCTQIQEPIYKCTRRRNDDFQIISNFGAFHFTFEHTSLSIIYFWKTTTLGTRNRFRCYNGGITWARYGTTLICSFGLVQPSRCPSGIHSPLGILNSGYVFFKQHFPRTCPIQQKSLWRCALSTTIHRRTKLPWNRWMVCLHESHPKRPVGFWRHRTAIRQRQQEEMKSW